MKTKSKLASGRPKKSLKSMKKTKTKLKSKASVPDKTRLTDDSSPPEDKVQFHVTSIHPTHAIGEIASDWSDERSRGILHASQLAEESNHMSLALHSIKPFQKLTCYVINRHNDDSSHKEIEVSQRPKSMQYEQSPKSFDVGTQLMAYVASFSNDDDVYDVDVTSEVKGQIHGYLIPDQPNMKKESYVGKALQCYVVKSSDPLQLRVKGTIIDGSTGEEVDTMREGCLITGKVQKVDTNSLLIRTVKGLGTAHITDIFDDYIDSPLQCFTPGQFVKCYVLKCPSSSMAKLSLKPSHNRVTESRDLATILTIDALKKGDLVQGYIKSANKHGVFISLTRSLVARAGHRSVPDDVVGDLEKILYPGRLVTCYVTFIGEGKVHVSLLRKLTGVSIDSKRSRETSVDAPFNKLAKIMYRTRAEVVDLIMQAKTSSRIEIRCASNLSDGDSIDPGWDDVEDDVTTGKAMMTSVEYESDAEDQPKAKQLSKKERLELAEAEESALRRREIELMDDTKAPRSTTEWERLMTSEPDNSMLWIRYMAFHIHATEIEEAREVAEKALRTINFRKENEKLNVWVSLLNLENMYGSDVTMEETLRRAMQENDQRKVLKHLINIYTQAEKLDKAKETHEWTIKKFRGDKESWLAYIRHLMVDHKQQNVQDELGRCLKSVEKQHHMEVISKVAQMEFKHGDVERGRTIFENLVTSFPKRTDVWSIYIDMLIQLERYDEAREIFNRVTSSNLSSKKVSSFFKRFVEFEVNHGSESTIHDAKNKAIAYLNDSAK